MVFVLNNPSSLIFLSLAFFGSSLFILPLFLMLTTRLKFFKIERKGYGTALLVSLLIVVGSAVAFLFVGVETTFKFLLALVIFLFLYIFLIKRSYVVGWLKALLVAFTSLLFTSIFYWVIISVLILSRMITPVVPTI